MTIVDGHGTTLNHIVQLTDIYKEYKKGKKSVSVFQNLNFSIQEGNFIAIMGPSGSGKTTLLNLIGGLDRPSAGSLKIGGTEINHYSSDELAQWRAEHVGFIFQFYNLIPVLTAEQNVELPLSLMKLSKDERHRRVKIALEVVGLSDRGRHYPNELSGGQQQRVAIARAIVTAPSILLCDEPTGDLDHESSEQILDLLQTLNSEYNKTIVMVTHDDNAAVRAKKKVVLNKGMLSEAENLSHEV